MEKTNQKLKILCIGNSFSQDTTAYVAEIAKAIGYEDVVIANLYIGGCPICKHYRHLQEDLPAYRYDRNEGFGWTQTPNCKISDAIKAEKWDWISIQHGSSGGERYTEPSCYQDLPALVEEVKALAPSTTKIAYNLTWAGEPEFDRPEMIDFGRDQLALFAAICHTTQECVVPVPGIDRVVPTGTAVQNARTTALKSRMSRDGYHLSYDIGRYLAGLIFFAALTGVSVENVSFRPKEVSDVDVELILRAVGLAMNEPYRVSTV